eukprot:CAMPEP_0197856006 /NCGR_PEP_ID=MMETSP1438-20131217/27703_1 /TAXON_ID=1461541 /ORGANISM="Pterosperma sp., Strain CCMP1384" /LENGTH=490 /DNA_ID=CAMNT_0043471313 /DNA_START=305 /DNA_END=1777 /DNA_ORIENTATION=-
MFGSSGPLQTPAKGTRYRRLKNSNTIVAKREVESEKIDAKVRDGVLDALNDLGSRVTVGDVAAKAGLKVETAEEGLRAVAADTQANIQVSEEGDVVYVFPEDPKAVLAAKSFAIRMAPLLAKMKSAGGYLMRVTFGTTLLVSVLVVYTAIFAILSSSRSSNSDDRGSSFNSGPRIGFYFNPFDMFWFYDPYYYQRRREEMQQGGGRQMNFLEAVFSFVFGDGDPNVALEEQKWLALGDLIASKGGVITAEQLAPYADDPHTLFHDSERYVDESFVVPILQRFGGVPEVDADGNLLYRFPQLQRSAGGYIGNKDTQDGNYLMESPWAFSGASTGQLMAVVALGMANLIGVGYLASLVANPSIVTKLVKGGYAPLVQFSYSILPPLKLYALSFFIIPIVRFLVNLRRNSSINKRNDQRRDAALVVVGDNPAVKKRLLSASQAAERKVIRESDATYNTADSVDSQDVEGREFDRRLRELEQESERDRRRRGGF